MMMQRLTKVVMCLALGAYASIVAYDNIVDYGTNYAFVQHVLSMDTTLPDNALHTRAVTSPIIWQIGYVSIIACEAVTGLLYIAAAVALWRERRAPAPRFEAAKRWFYAATIAGFLLWFVGFEVVGGEWFAMWQSPHWNGQQAAFRFYMTLVAVLLFVSRPDGDAAS